KPNPFCALNHVTVPVAISRLPFVARDVRVSPRDHRAASQSEFWVFLSLAAPKTGAWSQDLAKTLVAGRKRLYFCGEVKAGVQWPSQPDRTGK
ncbi:MAG: hypothetical protein Q7S17_00490, partial [Xanthobacteraceae bacterium]|nr:hypothetical protein [Xanthobacteraceae bacterium]